VKALMHTWTGQADPGPSVHFPFPGVVSQDGGIKQGKKPD
jgi:hypothetical protein